jgi:hypothetical protein
MSNYCLCGCGNLVKNKWHIGHNRKGVSPKNKKGYTIYSGRIFIRKPKHPNADTKGYVRHSHLVMENKIGRFIQTGEVVHHKNKNTLDDRIENLELLLKREHDRISVLVSEKCLHLSCQNKHWARGLCGIHYNRYRRRGEKMPFTPSRKNRWAHLEE